MSSIKEIIRSFVSSSPDDKTKSIFWAWLSSDRDREEKEQALSEVWQSSPSGSRKDTEKALVKVNRRIFGDADLVLRRRLRYAVAAAVILPVAVSFAGRQKAMPQSAAVAAVTTCGYAAITFGPFAIGSIGSLISLSGAFAVLGVLIILLGFFLFIKKAAFNF